MAASLARVSVLGAGSWGTALAALACASAPTLLWARDAALAAAITGTHQNTRYLPNIALPPELRCTDDFDEAISHAARAAAQGLVILAVPVAGLLEVCTRLANSLDRFPDTALNIIWTCKGFHPDNGRLPHEIAEQAFVRHARLGLGVLSGPSFAREVAQGLPVALTIASKDAATRSLVTDVLHGTTARIYASPDVIGVEAGGALKNIMAIACGIADGLQLGANARAALITRGLAEMQRLGVALGGEPDTFSGLTGMGDLVLTATGDLSRNRQVGLAIGRGETLDSILASGTTVEGVRCVRAVLELANKHHIDMPLAQAVCDVLFNGVTPKHVVASLLAREARAE